MMIRIYGINVRNRPAAIALAAGALAIGAVFVAFGIVLLLGLAAIGTALGAGALAVRALTQGRLRTPRADRMLDPALEVFPADRGAASPVPPHESTGSQPHHAD